MQAASNRQQQTFAEPPTLAASVCDQIVSLRVTALEELDGNRFGPYSRHYFRTLGSGRRPVRFAVVGSSQFTPELELELMQRGFDGVAIRDPADDEVERLGDFHLAPEWVRWVMPCPDSVDAWIAGVGNSNARNQLRRKLRTCDAIRAQVAPLILGDYRKWYEELYVPEILSKPGAIPAWQGVAHFARKVGLTLVEPVDSQQAPGILRVFLFDERDALVGGLIVSVDEAERTLRIRAGAFEAHSRSSRELAVKAMAAVVEEGLARGCTSLSYGDDPNLYGIDVTLGLERFKASLGMRPIPSRSGRFQLFKPFATLFDQLGAEVNEETYAGLFCFAVAGEGASRVAAYQRLKVLPTGSLAYRQQADLMLADGVGLQLGANPRADAMKVPKGMALLRVDYPDAGGTGRSYR